MVDWADKSPLPTDFDPSREMTAEEKSAAILAIAAEIRSHFKRPFPTSDHSDLYGEDGLPA